MTSSPVTAASLYTGNPLQIFKGTSGLVLIRDYVPGNIVSGFTPVDATSGLLIGNLKTALDAEGFGYVDLGGFDENGIEFDRSNTMASDKWMQSPDIQREDVTERTSGFSVTSGQLTPIVDRINAMLPISGAPAFGAAGYTVTPDADPTSYEYDCLVIATDKKYGIVNRIVWFPRVTAAKPDKESYSRKTSTMSKLTFDSLIDPTLNAPYQIFVDGPGWRALGGATGTPGGTVAPVATLGESGDAKLTFTAPTSANGPWTYAVHATVSGTTTAVPTDDVTVDSSSTSTNIVLDLTDLTSGATTFTVTATGSNLVTSAPSLPSNSVTIA